MKYFLSLCGVALLIFAARGPLLPWAVDVIKASAVEAALYRTMDLPDGPVSHLRSPVETRDNLTKLIAQKATPELYGLRAREEERAGNYNAAEADWKLSPLPELADFYERRVEPAKEVATLLQVGAVAQSAEQRFIPEPQQPQWMAFARAVAASQEALLGPGQQAAIYDAWIARFPHAREPYEAYLHWAIATRNRNAATNVAARFKAAFPQDVALAVTTNAELAEVQAGNDAALAVYASNFSPLWPDTLRTKYFEKLTAAHRLRSFLGDAQGEAAANPNDLRPVTRVFFYYESENRKPAADAELLRFVARRDASKNAWTSEELKSLAALFLRVQDYDESARFSFLLHSSGSSSASDKEAGLASIISLLLEVPEQRLSFANRDLSLYQNIATMDRHPGFLNGILTVALNTTDPEGQYANASQTASSYFHRAAASRLLEKLQEDFPTAARLPELQAELFNVYALYGQDDALLRDVPAWLTRNANAEQYVSAALLLADAYMRRTRTVEELAVYDRLLQTLGEKSEHMPIGSAGVITPTRLRASPQIPNARIPEYARVLDRYVSRLVALKRVPDALVLLRREIDRNPEDAGLYERLALFVEQNHLDNDLEQTYRAAFSHFNDTSWADKLARLYLREQRTAAYETLSRQIANTFKGTQLVEFLDGAPPNSPTVFRQVNLYAHVRFPHNMVFVSNLLRAYRTKPTVDHAAYEKLLRENWFNDAGFRTLYFESLTRNGKLRSELAALPGVDQSIADKNPAALEFQAEAQSWLTEFEKAAPVFVRLASLAPGDRQPNDRAIAVERSLAPTVSGAFDTAVKLAMQDITAAPADREAVVRTGEILADREQYAQARRWWLRSAAIHPGAADGYLNATTVFWDYLQFDDALRTIANARMTLNRPSVFAYEAGAIDENQGRYKEAVAEYTRAADTESSVLARSRLLTLARRPATAALVEQQTTSLVSGNFNLSAFDLRVAILENQNRRTELRALLSRVAASGSTSEVNEAVRAVADRLGFNDIAVQTITRTIAITKDPIEKLSARLDLAHFYEAHSNAAAAEREYNSLVADEPNRLGIVRAIVDYQWRTKQPVKAVGSLVAAADRAQQPYQNQLRREAAEKATESGQYTIARTLLGRLLQADRYNGDLLAEKAATYAREGDNAGLTKFYATTLAQMSQAALPSAEKMSRMAALRRGYILALTTGSQFSEALEQYQLVLNAYPEDTALTSEVGRFAEEHELAARVVGYYEKATKDSPRDYRWPLVLARLQSYLGHYPEAIAAYEKAAYVRPDRSDMPLAKADLQVRLLRFNDAIKTYQTLYELSYHDRQYLAAQADAYARLGNLPEALRLLRGAYIQPNAGEPGGYITAMNTLNGWHRFNDADAVFQELRPLLAAKPELAQQALSAEIAALVPLHRTADAINLVAAVAKTSTDTASLAKLIASSANQYLTPDEKVTLGQQVERSGGLPAQFSALQFSEALGLRDVQAKLLLKMSQWITDESSWKTLDQLQGSRLLFADAGRELESLAQSRRSTPLFRDMEKAAFEDFRKAGDTAAQLRLLNYSGDEYAKLFISAGGDLNRRLYTLAAGSPTRANAVVQQLLATAPSDVVHAAIDARGRRISPLWTNSYTALSGLYLLSPEPWVRQAFAAVLGPRTVSGELARHSDKSFLRGYEWFYYAGRYSEYLDNGKSAEANEYRAQVLEFSPAASESYVALGDSLADSQRWNEAEEQYKDALQLSPRRADVYDRLGIVSLRTGRREEAIGRWRKALDLLTERVEAGPLPPEYWGTARTLLGHINLFRAMTELKPGADALLRTYIKRNQLYEVTPLIEGVFEKVADRRATVIWVIELAQMLGAEGLLREVLNNSDLVTASEKDALYRAELTRAENGANAAAGEAGVEARNQVRQIGIEYIAYLEDQGKWADAWVRLQAIQTAAERPSHLLLPAGALTGHLSELVKAYKQQPATAPTGEEVLAAAASMQKLGHRELALQLEEFEYGREMQAGTAPSTAYFGLARMRFQQKRNDEGLALIRTVALIVGAPFENMKSAVEELQSSGRKSDAARFAMEWRNAEPWNDEAQLAAAQLAGDMKGIDAVRRNRGAEYAVRVRAARAMRDLHSPVTGSDELAALTHANVTAQEAAQPLAIEVRLDAARAAKLATEKVKLYRELIAIDPNLQEAHLGLTQAAFDGHQDGLALQAFQSAKDSGLDDAPYARAQRTAADASARSGNFGLALTLYIQLLGRETDEARKAELTQARDEVLAKQNLQTLNLARRPVVTKDITQRALIRPKLASLPASEGTIQ